MGHARTGTGASAGPTTASPCRPAQTTAGRAGYDARAPTLSAMVSPTGPTPDDLAVPVDSTVDLLARAKTGDDTAIDTLFRRCLPPLHRWARGRLPSHARNLGDTQDLVQEAVMHALRRLEAFECRHQGALQAYLRQAIQNRIVDEVRRAQRRPSPSELLDHHADPSPSALQRVIGMEGLEAYETALQRLKPAEREAVIARIELQQSYEEIAVALDKPTVDAARVAVKRALARLVEEMAATEAGRVES
jgi:RNA polymerase sigma factor (sigma-70 family)